MRTLIIFIVIAASCSPRKKETSIQELRKPEPVQESNGQMIPPEPNKLYNKFFGQWHTDGNDGVIPLWFEFDSVGSNFYSWIATEEEKSEKPSGTYEIYSDSVLQLTYSNFQGKKRHYFDFDGINKMVLTPLGPSAGKLIFSRRTYEAPPKKWMVPEKLTISKIIGTKWLNSNFDGCTSYYRFRERDSYFEHFNCSMDELDTGRFEVVHDTLKVYEYRLISEVPKEFGGEEGTEIRFEYHFILNQNTLRPTFFKDHKHGAEIFKKDTTHQYKKQDKMVSTE